MQKLYKTTCGTCNRLCNEFRSVPRNKVHNERKPFGCKYLLETLSSSWLKVLTYFVRKMIARSAFLPQYTLSIAFRMTALHVFISFNLTFMISGLRREVDENCALLVYYAASIGNFWRTFRDKLSVRYSGVNPWRLDPTGCPETSVRNYHYWLRNNPEERSYQLIAHTLNWLIESVSLTPLQTFRFAPLVELICCSFRSYNLQYDKFVQKCSNILLPPSSGWLCFVKFFAEVLSVGTPSIVCILANHCCR